MTKTSGHRLSFIGLFAALTAIGAFISFPLPFTPVPFTLQVTFTTMAGFALGSKYGALSQLVYLLLGAIGLPVFANRLGGIGALFGHTAGFLWGFVLSAMLIGWLATKYRPRKALPIVIVLTAGLLLVYATGTVGLMVVLGLPAKQAFMAGVAPFMILDLLKIGLAAFLIMKLEPLGLLPPEKP